MEFEIKQKEEGSKGAFFIEIDGVSKAESTYSKAGEDKIIIDHTEVDDSLRGTGAGLALVKGAVAWARENNKKILPLCPFAHSVFKKHREFKDVWA